MLDNYNYNCYSITIVVVYETLAMITKEYLDKFRKLYKDKYNITLSDEETTELATHFLNLMEILIRPKPKAKPVNMLSSQSYTPERRHHETGRI